MAQENNFLDELGLERVINYIKSRFSTLSHSHELSEITDYQDETVEITQEDYIALGDAVKTNGITYFIKDAKSYVTSLGIAIQAVKALPSDAASKTNTLYLIAGDAIEVEVEVSSVEKVLGLPSDASNNPDVMYVVL